MPRMLEENENKNASNLKRSVLLRDDVEYTAQKIFTYAIVGLAAITVYASVTYLVIQQLKK